MSRPDLKLVKVAHDGESSGPDGDERPRVAPPGTPVVLRAAATSDACVAPDDAA